MKSVLLWLALSLWLAVSIPAHAALTAEVDRRQLAANESFTLTLRHDGQTTANPDFSPLEHDFEILSRQRQSHLAFGAGAGESSTEWILRLAPRRSGDLVVPSLNLNGEVTDAIPLEVTEPRSEDSGERPVFVETELDRESVRVQAQTILTLRLNTAVMLRNVEIPEPDVPGARVLKLDDAQYRKTIDGREHIVVELKFALFPEEPGTLEIPPLRFSGVITDRNDPFTSRFFSGTGRRVQLSTQPLSLEVKPIPEEADESDWIPARGLSVGQRWSRERDSVQVGEPITRTITITAQGLPGAQLPPLELEAGEGYRRYPDQPEISESLTASGVVGKRVESAAIVPTQPGPLTLPPVTLTWWDTESERLRETTLDAVTLEVAPAPEAQAQEQEDSEARDDNATNAGDGADESRAPALWPPEPLALSLLANALLLIAAGWLALSRRHAGTTPPGVASGPAEAADEADAFQTLRRATRAAALREAVLHWARLYWSDREGIHTLDQVAELAGDDQLHQAFDELDRGLYADSGDTGDAMENVKTRLATLRKAERAQRRSRRQSLEPLYPS